VAGQDLAVAEGWFVHVFVDRAARTSTPIPDGIRAALTRLL
jgi:acyl-CoA thioester hydrolase